MDSGEILKKYTNRVYSDKLQLNVLSLRNIENATPKERASGLYDWAKLFAATTWEELKMAAKSEGMKSAVVTLRKLTADDKVRLQCEARERYETTERTWETLLREAEEGKALAEKELASRDQKLASAEQERDAAREEIRAFYEMLAENPSLSADEILKRMKS